MHLEILISSRQCQKFKDYFLCKLNGQAASIEALIGDQSTVDNMIEVFKDRRDYMIELLNNLPEVDCLLPGGAFYAFPNFNFYRKHIKTKRLMIHLIYVKYF